MFLRMMGLRLEAKYAMVYFDALIVKVRQDKRIINTAYQLQSLDYGYFHIYNTLYYIFARYNLDWILITR